MKYVILHPREVGLTRILFTVSPTTHADLAKPYQATHTPKSAGFCDFATGFDPQRPAVRVFGHSESLKLKSHPDDARLISASIAATLRIADA